MVPSEHNRDDVKKKKEKTPKNQATPPPPPKQINDLRVTKSQLRNPESFEMNCSIPRHVWGRATPYMGTHGPTLTPVGSGR